MCDLFHGLSGDAAERKLLSLSLGPNVKSERLLNRRHFIEDVVNRRLQFVKWNHFYFLYSRWLHTRCTISDAWRLLPSRHEILYRQVQVGCSCVHLGFIQKLPLRTAFKFN